MGYAVIIEKSNFLRKLDFVFDLGMTLCPYESFANAASTACFKSAG